MLVVHNSIKYVNQYFPPTNHWLILVASIPVALATGTLFVFSVYGTQLAERCHLASSQAANLNISATVGTAIGGVVSGIITDVYGTQIPILSSGLCLFVGYKWLHHLFLVGPEASHLQLLSSMFLIGIGSVSGYFSSIKGVTINFPNYKGTAQSITIASFAISSLVYLFISSKVFKGDVAAFLQFLYISSGIMLFLGFVFIRIDGYIDTPAVDTHETVPAIEEQPFLSAVLSNEAYETLPTMSQNNDLKNKSLLDSVAHPVFWVHYIILSIIQGLGQMYIYSVGFIIKAVYYHYTNSPEAASSHPSLIELQALHVSLVAISSFFGRLTSGPQADFLVRKLHFQRHWILIWGLSIMFLGHLLNSFRVESHFSSLHQVNTLLLVGSCFIGYAYGFSFTCYPAIISDLFNMKNYSFIWGIMYTSTTLGLTVMTKLFGHIYDSNSDATDDKTGELFCDKGSGCYNSVFTYTASFSVLAMGTILGYIYSNRR